MLRSCFDSGVQKSANNETTSVFENTKKDQLINKYFFYTKSNLFSSNKFSLHCRVRDLSYIAVTIIAAAKHILLEYFNYILLVLL